MFVRMLTTTCFAALALGAFQPASAYDDDDRYRRFAKESTSVAPVGAFPVPLEARDGTSILNRTKTGVGFVFNTTDLQPKAPYTVWWVVFNKPRHCATPHDCGAEDLSNPKVRPGVFFAAGRLSDAQGQANFAAQIDYGALPDGEDQVPNPDRDHPIRPGAEIHLVIRSHGPASKDPEVLAAQLSQFNGGCPPEDCANVQASIHPAKRFRLL